MFYSVFGNIDYEAVKRDEFDWGICSNRFDSILLLQNDITLLSFPMGDKVCAICAKEIQIK